MNHFRRKFAPGIVPRIFRIDINQHKHPSKDARTAAIGVASGELQ
jgi:hypothetical protein